MNRFYFAYTETYVLARGDVLGIEYHHIQRSFQLLFNTFVFNIFLQSLKKR